MKSLACVFALLVSGVAHAQTSINLPSPPVLNYYTNANCHYQPIAWTSANGFTADGNYLNGVSQGYVACGHSGRGSNLVYTYYCMLDKWDLSGNLVSVVVQPYATCSALMRPQPQWQTWTTRAGYQAYTVTNSYYGYIAERYAVLVTP